MRQRANTEDRSAYTGRDFGHRRECVIEKIVQLENDCRRGGDIQSDGHARTIQIKVGDRAIKAHDFISQNGRDVSAFVEIFPADGRRKLVRTFQVEAILSRRALRYEFGQLSNRGRIIRIDYRRPGTLAWDAADDVRATVFAVDNQRAAMIRTVDEKNRYRLRQLSLFVEMTFVT